MAKDLRLDMKCSYLLHLLHIVCTEISLVCCGGSWKPSEPRKKKHFTFHYTGWLIGILMMVH